MHVRVGTLLVHKYHTAIAMSIYQMIPKVIQSW